MTRTFSFRGNDYEYSEEQEQDFEIDGVHIKTDVNGVWYRIGDHYMSERDICQRCIDVELRPAEERYSLGIYAGRHCDACWDASGYRKEGSEGFDRADAGESYYEEY